MAEITYLLGAGASCNALPMVNDMASKIEEAIGWFRNTHVEIYPRYTNVNGVNIRRGDLAKQEQEYDRIVQDLTWLKEICDTTKNFSIDTYARKLNISGNTADYIKLKNVLSLYFTLEQKRNLPDVRYDNFWASILKSRTQFPDNLKIISWNYDFQLELTYSDFYDHDSLKVIREVLNISSQETQLINLGGSNKFSIFKLNGSATFNTNSIENRDVNYFIDDFKTSKIEDFIPKLIEGYDNLCTKSRIYKNHLSFAWEHQTDSHFFSHLKESLKDTEILVVIGYSFPFF